MAAQAMGRIAACSGNYRTEHIAFQVRRSIEWLFNEKNEGKKQAAVSDGIAQIQLTGSGYSNRPS